MKIAYIYDVAYPWVTGGGERRIYELAIRLAKRGHEVHWFSLKWWDGPSDITWGGIYFHGVGKQRELYKNGRRDIGEALYFAWKIFRKFRGDFDVVDSQNFPYFHNFAAGLKRVNLVITWHEVWGNYWLQYLGRLGVVGVLIERALAHVTKNHVAVSKRTARELEKMGVKPYIIPNGVDTKKINGVKPAEEEFDVVFAGRLIKEKRVDLLLRSLVLLKDLKALIVGDGPEKPKLVKLARELGLRNVKFINFLKYEDLIAYMKSSKVFVLPSMREGFGIVVLEANAAGLPVVVVRHEMNAAVDLVEDGKNGFVAEPTAYDLAEKIRLAIEQSSIMKHYAVEFAKRYDWERITYIAEAYYKHI